MIKAIKFGNPICWNPKGNNIAGFINVFNGTFSAGKPISVMINKGDVIQGNSCHYIWGFPETVLFIKKNGTHGIARVQTYTQIEDYENIWFAIGGVGISNYDPKAEGFSVFKKINKYTGKLESKDFSDVLDKTYHSVFGFKGNDFFAAIMYGSAEQIVIECKKQGYTDVVMGDGRSWASCKTDEFNLHLNKGQFSAVQIENVVDLEVIKPNNKMEFVDGILTSYNKRFKIDLIPKDNKTSRPQYKLDPKHITIHNTGNTGATAEQNSEYVDNAFDKYVSWHFTIGNGIVIQEMPINEVAWHAGDGGKGPGNRNSIAIEIAEVEGAYKTAIEFIKDLMKYLNFGIDKIYPHKHWSGKNCPRLILPKWDKFIQELGGEVEELINYKELYEEAQLKLDKIKEII